MDDYCTPLHDATTTMFDAILHNGTRGSKLFQDPLRGPPGPAHYSLPKAAVQLIGPPGPAHYSLPKAADTDHHAPDVTSHSGDHAEDSHCNEVHEESHDGCHPSHNPHPNAALFAIILTLSTFLISFFLRYFRTSQFLSRTVSRV